MLVVLLGWYFHSKLGWDIIAPKIMCKIINLTKTVSGNDIVVETMLVFDDSFCLCIHSARRSTEQLSSTTRPLLTQPHIPDSWPPRSNSTIEI